MNIGGLQQTSLLDYPNQISAIIWTIGCNLHCPFCYNKDIVEGNVHSIPEKEVLTFLKKRQGMLDALVITGGEPLLQSDITNFIQKVRQLNYLVKIDTNGMFPEQLNVLLENELIDYVAMDIKAPKQKYPLLSGVKTLDLLDIESSIKLIQKKAPDYEFRTTFVPQLLTKEDIVEIAHWLQGSQRFYLQQFKHDTPLLNEKLGSTPPYSKEYLHEVLEAIRPFFTSCDLRGE